MTSATLVALSGHIGIPLRQEGFAVEGTGSGAFHCERSDSDLA